MFIRSERLFLRPGWPEDWRDVLDQIGDAAVARNLDAAPWLMTGDAARQPDRLCPHFLITLPGARGAQLVGCIGLQRETEGTALGYWIGRDHWGRGYATEAARAVLRLARTLGHRQVFASHFTDNAASAHVLRKLGFGPTGLTRDTRGEGVPAEVLAIALGDASDCDGGDNRDSMRAA
jgi:RimJ/RimL family protein N-acetyltransferase